MPSRFWKASGNALLPGKGILSVGSAFSPSSLSPNIWIEADPAKLYTDAGTTLVSADSQAVQQANDKSTNARNVSQSTSTQRPLYRSGTKPYLQTDGVDDTLVSASFAGTDGSGQCWFAISASITDTSINQQLAEFVGGSDVAWVRVNGGNAQCLAFDSVGSATTDSGSALVNNTPFVLIATITTTAVEIWVDNSSAGSTALTGTRQTNSAQFYLGSHVAFNAWLAGKIYGVVQGSGTLSSTDRGNLQTYMAALHP